MDEASIASALWSIITEPELQAKLRTCGPARSAQFSWARTAEQTLSILRSVVQQGGKK
jgi:glycosyltransferase involved in cell wall biosynthesis